MAHPRLSGLFSGVGAKRLKAVEVDTEKSNQHELDGIQAFRAVLGDAKRTFTARFVYLSESQEEPIAEDGTLTWYDARERHPTRSEWRAYFPRLQAMESAAVGDLCVVARRTFGAPELLVLIAEQGSTPERQLMQLFHLPWQLNVAFGAPVAGPQDRDVEITVRMILDQLGIETELDEFAGENALKDMVRRFPDGFPTTQVFSAYARSMAPVDCRKDPDGAVVRWFEVEETLFRNFERSLVREKLAVYMKKDEVPVDDILEVSMSVIQRRRSRAGNALENHLRYVFDENHVRYSLKPITEGKSKPDFLFPGIREYHDPRFPETALSILGVKATCRDRWRQVLAEAERVREKSIFTLEPAISVSQTDEMNRNNVRLVLPEALHKTFEVEQRGILRSLIEFISALEKENRG